MSERIYCWDRLGIHHPLQEAPQLNRTVQKLPAEALIILAKAADEEYPITDTGVTILRSLALSKAILKRVVLNKPTKN